MSAVSTIARLIDWSMKGNTNSNKGSILGSSAIGSDDLDNFGFILQFADHCSLPFFAAFAGKSVTLCWRRHDYARKAPFRHRKSRRPHRDPLRTAALSVGIREPCLCASGA